MAIQILTQYLGPLLYPHRMLVIKSECSIQAYKYRAAAFACTGDSIDTCGKRTDQFTPNTTAIFEELSIVAVVPSPVNNSTLGADDSAFFPVSLDISITPLEAQDFDYEEERQQDITQLVLNLRRQDAELYSFAIWGRVFEWDGQDASPSGDDHAGDDDTGAHDDEQLAGSATGTSVCKALVLLLLAFKFL